MINNLQLTLRHMGIDGMDLISGWISYHQSHPIYSSDMDWIGNSDADWTESVG